jgi:diacylglycerol O-acyltransferase
MTQRERMSAMDTAWLRMDAPNNPMMIVCVQVFETPLARARLAAVVEERLVRYARFRQRVVRDLAGIWWEEDRYFSLDHHVRTLKLPGAGGKPELQAAVARLAGAALDPARPLWQLDLVERYEGGSALVVRIHHCIADGIALVGVLLSMAGTTPDGPPLALGAPVAGKGAGRAADPNPWRALIDPVTQAAVRALSATGTLTSKALSGTTQWMQDPSRLGRYARLANQVALDAGRLALMAADTPTPLRGKPGGIKRVAWCEPLPLAEIKAVGKALEASVNDVLLCCVAGAIGTFLAERGGRLGGAELRAMVPVNLRPPGAEHELGNRFGLVPLLLPIGIRHPVERLHAVRSRMQELKQGYQAVLAMGVLNAVGFLPGLVQDQVLNLFSSKATAVMTNVPGPQQPLYLAGARIAQVMFWVPQAGDIAVGVSILSYAGGVQFGLILDDALGLDPQAVIDCFAPAFEQLVMSVLLAGEG